MEMHGKKSTQSIIRGLSHGLVVTDHEGVVQTYNVTAKSILLPFGDSMKGRNLLSLVAPEAGEILQNLLHAPLADNGREVTFSIKGDAGKDISYSILSREDANGSPIGLILSLSDISELKYARKEMEKMNRLATIAEIASAVAHEVRNPLAGIKIMAQSIEEESITQEEQRECSKRIARQVDRLNNILTDFFSYARPATPQISPISLVESLAEIQPLIKTKLSKKHIEVEEHHESNLPLIVADAGQVQQVLLNLFLNAVDAIRQGGTICIVTKKICQEDLLQYKMQYPGILFEKGYVCLRFSDNGAGMDPGVSEQVFEPFFTTKSSGTGLGLSIVYRTLIENGAAITVESVKGVGTTFTIFFKAIE